MGLTEKINYAISLNTGIMNMSLSVSPLHIMHILGTVYTYTHNVWANEIYVLKKDYTMFGWHKPMFYYLYCGCQ